MGPDNKDVANTLEELYENVILKEAMNQPPPHIQQLPAFSHAFTEFIKGVENPNKKGYQNGKWYPFRVSSSEIDIGYGHKINPGESFKDGLTDHQVEHLLTRDLETAEVKARFYVNHHHGKDAWETLDKVRKEMLIDFTFNIGSLTSFPKFVKAVVYNDVAGMKKEYVRTAMINGQRVAINRNQKFFDTFLKNYHGGYFVASR